MALRMSIARKLALGFALGPLILALIGGVAYVNTTELQATARWVTHTYQVLDTSSSLLTQLSDAETGQRGYLLTGEERYLEPYRSALDQIEKAFATLAALTSDNPKQQGRLVTLRPLLAAKLDELAETIRLRRDKGFDAAVEIVRTDRGKKAMDDIRRLIYDLDQEENQLLRDREAVAARAAQTTFDTIVFGTLVSFLVLAGLGYIVTRSITVPVRGAVNDEPRSGCRAAPKSGIALWNQRASVPDLRVLPHSRCRKEPVSGTHLMDGEGLGPP